MIIERIDLSNLKAKTNKGGPANITTKTRRIYPTFTILKFGYNYPENIKIKYCVTWVDKKV